MYRRQGAPYRRQGAPPISPRINWKDTTPILVPYYLTPTIIFLGIIVN